MKAVIVDSDPIRIDMLCRILSDYDDTISVVATFTDSSVLIDYLSSNNADLIFLEINKPRIDGISIGTKIREFSYDIAIIYTASSSVYAVEAFKLYAQGYIIKPFSKKDVFTALDNAKHMLLHSKRISAVTFGNFDLFTNGKVVHFSRSKSKEFLALLIDRCGGEVSLSDVATHILDSSSSSTAARQLARKIVSTLKKDLEYYGLTDICTFKYGVYAINPNMLDCDSYKLLAGDKNAANLFSGEYMTQYQWAKHSIPKLLAAKEKATD